jgi:hypothetical protein
MMEDNIKIDIKISYRCVHWIMLNKCMVIKCVFMNTVTISHVH